MPPARLAAGDSGSMASFRGRGNGLEACLAMMAIAGRYFGGGRQGRFHEQADSRESNAPTLRYLKWRQGLLRRTLRRYLYSRALLTPWRAS